MSHATPPKITADLLEELVRLSQSISQQPPAATGPLWGAAHKVILKAKVDPALGARLVMNRDAAGLASLVAALRGDPVSTAEGMSPMSLQSLMSPQPALAAAVIDPETLKQAMRAFRKRLKLMRLDQESSLGVGPMSGGRQSDIDAIVPPREFPMTVWAALADAGKLRRAGPGMFELVEE